MKKPFSDPSALFQCVLLFVQKRAGLTVAFFALVIGICAWGLKFTKLELDIYDVYDSNFQSSIDLFEMKEYYGDQAQVLVAFNFSDIPKSGEVCKLLNWSRELNRLADIKNVTSLWSLRAPKMQDGKLWYPKTLNDPCTLDPQSEFHLSEVFKESFFRHLVSKSGSKDLVFDVSFTNSGANLKEIQSLMDHTDTFTKKEFKDVKVRYLGLATSRYYFRKIMQRDSIYSMLVLLVILLFMRVVYGTWRSGGYLILTLVGSGIILYGLMALFGMPIDILTNNLFLMTAVSGTADFIFVTQYQMTGNYQDSLKKLIRPSFFTSLTTIVGFLSLNTSDLSLIQRFGNGAAIGGVAEWLMLFLLLPALLKLLNKEKVWVNPKKALSSKWAQKIEEFNLPGWCLKLLMALMVVSVPAFFFLNDQDSPVLNLPKDHVMRVGYEDFQKKFGWQGQVYLYFPSRPSISDQELILNKIKSSPMVSRVEDPEEMAREWTRDFPPLKQELIRRELSMTPLWEKYYSNADTLRVPLYLKEQDLHSLRKFRDEILPICQDKCRIAGQRVVYLEYGEKISRTMIESFAVSIILVVGILTYLLWTVRKLQHFWAVVLSSLMGPLVILTIISIFQIPVTLITSIFLAVMVGLAGDNAIQYMLTDDENLERGIEGRARASIMVTLVMIMASAMFLLQTLKPMKILGTLFVLGFFINLVGDLFGFKGLLTRKSDQ
ncbi:MMPL family transporter [Peredibacter sp. HCB2-198]|uniref:MMPL family transporter n=1 Tax=Peredibacter sp. HCB2-198 TaxID=3383025 RepID=UPI0038B443F5